MIKKLIAVALLTPCLAFAQAVPTVFQHVVVTKAENTTVGAGAPGMILEVHAGSNLVSAAKYNFYPCNVSDSCQKTFSVDMDTRNVPYFETRAQAAAYLAALPPKCVTNPVTRITNCFLVTTAVVVLPYGK